MRRLRSDSRLLAAGVSLGVVCCSALAVAEPPESRGNEPRPRKPPPQVVAACAGTPLCPLEVQQVASTAAAALADDTLTVAVVDRLGNVLAVFRKAGAVAGDEDRAVGLARTAAFFSNDQAPLSSRTVRFVSGIHFPPGIARTPNGALYGIENTNRGCSVNAPLNAGALLPEGRSLAGVLGGLACDALDRSGCGPGMVTGKADLLDSDFRAVDPGGVPIYRTGSGSARVVGGVGVVGVPAAAAEYAAFRAAFGAPSLAPLPQFPLPPPGNVFIDGVRLPFVQQTTRPPGFAAGSAAGAFVVGPSAGVEPTDGYLIGPRAGSQLSSSQVDAIVRQAEAAAGRTRAVIRLPLGSRSRMAIAVADLDGTLLALFRMPDTTVFSGDVAVAKARNVVYFSQSPAAPADLTGVPASTAVTNRTINFGAQPLYPPGINGSAAGPFFDLFQFDSANPCSQGHEAPHPNQSGIVFFAGSLPLYRGSQLVGGLGVSGDGVEQDDYVSLLGAEGFLPPESSWANRVVVRGARLPFLKLPRNPED